MQTHGFDDVDPRIHQQHAVHGQSGVACAGLELFERNGLAAGHCHLAPLVYLDDEPRTVTIADAAAFAEGGWFRTGDLAIFDGTHLVIVDRLKDIIIRGGENISALEVESALVTHPAVVEAACVAFPDPVMGEKVCAFVIPAPGPAPTLDDLRAHVLATGLARFKAPERLEVRADLPRTASGKVRKAPLRAELRDR